MLVLPSVNRSAVLLGLAAVLASTVGFCVVITDEASNHELHRHEDAGSTIEHAPPRPELLDTGAREALPEGDDPSDQPNNVPPSRRDYLREYWGDRWPEIEAANLKQGVDLDQPMEIVPWESAAERLGAMVPLSEARWRSAVQVSLGWHDDTYEISYQRWIRSNFGVGGEYDEQEIRGLEDICRSMNEQLHSIGELYASQLDAHLRDRWNRGAFVKAPFTTIGVAPQQGFYSTSGAADGWSYVITLMIEDCPDLAQTMKEADALRKQRDQTGRQYLLGLRQPR